MSTRTAIRTHSPFVHVVSGVVVVEATVLANNDGYAEALRLVEEHAPGRRVFAIEGTGSYGLGLTRFLTGSTERVLEVGRLKRDAPLGRQNRRPRRGPCGAQHPCNPAAWDAACGR